MEKTSQKRNQSSVIPSSNNIAHVAYSVGSVNDVTSSKGREKITNILFALENLRSSPNLNTFIKAIEAYQINTTISLYRCEIWSEVCLYTTKALTDNMNPLERFKKQRGAFSESRQINHKNTLSRTLLVKGLEYDNVVIENASNFTNAKNFYVAMTRAKQKLVIFSDSSSLQFPPIC